VKEQAWIYGKNNTWEDITKSYRFDDGKMFHPTMALTPSTYNQRQKQKKA
jgi:hypothetical protein